MNYNCVVCTDKSWGFGGVTVTKQKVPETLGVGSMTVAVELISSQCRSTRIYPEYNRGQKKNYTTSRDRSGSIASSELGGAFL